MAWEEVSGTVLLPQKEKRLAGFRGSVSVPLFSCKPSLPSKVQHKLLIDHQ